MGAGATVANSEIKESAVLEGSKVVDSKLERVLVMKGCTVSGSVLRNVILGEGCRIGYGCDISNEVLGDGTVIEAVTTITGDKPFRGCMCQYIEMDTSYRPADESLYRI